MKGFNKVTVAGNVTKDPEIRYTTSGVAIASFSVAINRSYTTKDGEKKEDVLFIEINAWRKLADICNNYLKKGSPVLVDGRLKENRWTDNDGRERKKMFIEAIDIVLLPRGDKQSSTFQSNENSESLEGDDDDVPF